MDTVSALTGTALDANAAMDKIDRPASEKKSRRNWHLRQNMVVITGYTLPAGALVWEFPRLVFSTESARGSPPQTASRHLAR